MDPVSTESMDAVTTTSADATTTAATPRDLIATHVRRRGVASTARRMGVARTTLVSYLAAVAREGTALAVESRASRLADVDGAR